MYSWEFCAHFFSPLAALVWSSYSNLKVTFPFTVSHLFPLNWIHLAYFLWCYPYISFEKIVKRNFPILFLIIFSSCSSAVLFLFVVMNWNVISFMLEWSGGNFFDVMHSTITWISIIWLEFSAGSRLRHTKKTGARYSLESRITAGETFLFKNYPSASC